MSSLKGCGVRVKESRERLQLSREEFARRVGCQVEMLSALEEGTWDQPQSGVFPVLERISRELDTTPDVLMFSDTNLFNVRINDLKVQAVRLITSKQIISDLELIDATLEELEHEYEQSVVGEPSALAFRKRDQAFRIDEDRVRDLALQAKRRLERERNRGK